MGIESAADRLLFLETFGESATYTPQGGAAKTIQVLYDSIYAEAEEVESGIPIAEARTADLTGTIDKGTLVVEAGTFTILNNEPDSTGMTILTLKGPA